MRVRWMPMREAGIILISLFIMWDNQMILYRVLTLSVIFFVACQPQKNVANENSSLENSCSWDVELDELMSQAEKFAEYIAEKSPDPEAWGRPLLLCEYDPNYRGLNYPRFTFIDQATVRLDEFGQIRYTDLNFHFVKDVAAGISSHFRVRSLSEEKKQRFRPEEIVSFLDSGGIFSQYASLAADHVCLDGDKELGSLCLERIEIEYFENPQYIKFVFRDRAFEPPARTRVQSHSIYSVKLTFDGRVMR